ncbi:unnamed protein product [Staurois parvus]|uniref:Large ribosomal subunit protein uL16m n=1 Tax=Staurois parvus TaxID=386267 RepID=A0ABN9DTP9_9NEOB|nr:unnamed protein product [Staurois parvus]
MKEKPKLRVLNKVPDLVKAVKMPKNLRDIRGPATEGRDFREGEFGILALGGGYLHWGHFEMMRLTLNRKFNARTTFSLWMVEAPNKPITRKGLGHRMGGGKAPWTITSPQSKPTSLSWKWGVNASLKMSFRSWNKWPRSFLSQQRPLVGRA